MTWSVVDYGMALRQGLGRTGAFEVFLGESTLRFFLLLKLGKLENRPSSSWVDALPPNNVPAFSLMGICSLTQHGRLDFI